MSLYDDAGMISLPTGAAGKDNKLYNIKPVEKLKAEELITNGTFEDNDSEAAWLKVNSPTISNNQVRITDRVDDLPVRIYQTGVLEGGKTYRLSINVVEVKSGELRIGTGYSSNRVTTSTPISTPGNHSFVFLNTSGEDDEDWIFIRAEDESSDYDITFDNISVKEVEQEAKDFGFVRASSLTATRVAPSGYIEKGRENLLLQSNQFDTTWTKTLVTVSSGQSGFDGSSNAWLVTKTSTGSARLNQTSTAEGVFTYSCYAKAGTLDGVILRADSGSGNAEAQFDLTGDGSVYYQTGSCIDTSITKIGTSGWFRCSLTSNRTLTTLRIYPATETGALTSTGTIYIQNAQLEAGLVATDYIESHSTTGKAGILEDEPRFDHTGGGCPGLLLESQSINLVKVSEGDPAGTNNVTLTINHGTSPQGVKNSLKVLKTNDANDRIRVEDEGGLTLDTSKEYTISAFIKNIDCTGSTTVACRMDDDTLFRQAFGWASGSAGADVSVDSGSSVGNAGTRTNAFAEDYGNGWWRVGFTFTPTDTTANFEIDVDRDSSSASTLSSIETWGWQIEEGSFHTSYIPNYGASGGATRVRDDVGVITDTTTDGLTNGYNTTIYCKFKLLGYDRPHIAGVVNYYVPISGVQNDPRVLIYTGSSTGGTFKARLQYRIGNSGDNDQIIETPGTYNVGDEVKAIARITDYDITLFVNGTKFTHADHPQDATAGRPFKKSISGATLNGLDLTYSTNAAHHKVYEVITFPKALTDDECEDLTTV